MRIGQIAPLWATVPPLNYGGIELVLDLLCEGMIARGHEVTLFASADCRSSARIHPIIPKHLNALMEDGAAYISEYYTSAVMAEALAHQDEFDVLHSHLPLAWLPFAASSRVPCVATLHTSVHVDDLWVLDRYRQSLVVGISATQTAPVLRAINRELPVVPNAIDFSVYEPGFESGKYLAFLGRMSPEKNPLDAIQIAADAGMPLVMAGVPQGHQEVSYFENQIKPLIDGVQVRWLGSVNHVEKVKLLSGAAALLFPVNWEEPFGLVMIEAMACGTPVLACQRGSVPEIVQPGLTGMIGSSAAELTRLLPETLALDRRQVRAVAADRFGSSQMVDKYLAIYEQLVKTPKHSFVP